MAWYTDLASIVSGASDTIGKGIAIYGAYQNITGAQESSDIANRALAQQQGAISEEQDLNRKRYMLALDQYNRGIARQDTFDAIAQSVLGEANAYDETTREGFARVVGQHLKTLQGEDPASFAMNEGFYTDIDNRTVAQLKNLDNSAQVEAQRINDTVRRDTPGWLKAMAALRVETMNQKKNVEDERTKALQDRAQTIREQSHKDAMEFFKATPDQRLKYVQAASNIMGGAPSVNVPGSSGIASTAKLDPTLEYAVGQLTAQQTGLADIGRLLTTKEPDKTGPNIYNVYGTPTSIAEKPVKASDLTKNNSNFTWYDEPA